MNIANEQDEKENGEQCNKLDFVDVFSGIGGISLALKDYTNTILYCEQNAYCQAVLTDRMEEGLLDVSPIHSNICTLHLSKRSAPKMIGGGFPCQDISSIGLQKGIVGGERSSLFFEIMRIVDECPSIDYVFLENVANITKCGMKEVVEQLSKRNFDFQWTTHSAASMGAPHVRNRWFCLAIRHGADPIKLKLCQDDGARANTEFTWDNELFPRCTFRPGTQQDDSYDEQWIARCQTLGNTVVPCVVKRAFEDLIRMYSHREALTTVFAPYAVDVAKLDYPFNDSGFICGATSKFYPLPANTTVKKHNVSINVVHNGQTVKLQHLPTPRRGLCHPSTLTDRSLRDLPTVLINSEENLDYLRSIHYEIDPDVKLYTLFLPNVNYIEWMMGYQKDWTRVKRKVIITREKLELELVAADDDESVVSQNETTKRVQKTDTKVKQHHETGHIRKSRLNGMHIFMRENPGKDIRQISLMWNSLSIDQKTKYSDIARAIKP